MLAQGQSSSEKRGGLVADVSSGLIFLKKKKAKAEKALTMTETQEAIKDKSFFFQFKYNKIYHKPSQSMSSRLPKKK